MIHDVVVPDAGPLRADGTPQFGMITHDDATALVSHGRRQQRARPTSSRATAIRRAFRAPAITSPTCSRTSSPSCCRWAPTTASSRATATRTGSSTSTRTGSSRSTSCPSPAASRTSSPTAARLPLVRGPRLRALRHRPIGPGFTGGTHDPLLVGDNPNNPRDPDRLLDTSPSDPDRHGAQRRAQGEAAPLHPQRARQRDHARHLRPRRVLRARRSPSPAPLRRVPAEVARVDTGGVNGDGILTAVEVDLEDFSDGGLSNDRLFIPATQFNRFAVTREINDGLLAPRFAPASAPGCRAARSCSSRRPSAPPSRRTPTIADPPSVLVAWAISPWEYGKRGRRLHAARGRVTHAGRSLFRGIGDADYSASPLTGDSPARSMPTTRRHRSPSAS